jgi:hypothetical protein
MRLKISTQEKDIVRDLALFLELVGEKRFDKRVRQLRSELANSVFLGKIVIDYHWLELCLHELISNMPSIDNIFLDDWCAIKLALMSVKVHQRLSARGKRELKGRILDSIKSDYGFAPLYLEMDIALRLLSFGFEVQFSDLENLGQFDLLVGSGNNQLEIECKSQSVDAGRKIHRRDFYRLAQLTHPTISKLANSKYSAVIVSLADRLPSNDAQQQQIAVAIHDLVGSKDSQIRLDDVGVIKIENLALLFNHTIDWEGYFKKKYGENIHISGTESPSGCCFFIVKSDREDDTSKPLLVSMKKACSQFSGERASLICLQFNEYEPMNLAQDNVKRRNGILSNHLFNSDEGKHLGAVMVGCYKNSLSDIRSFETPPAFIVGNENPSIPIPRIFDRALRQDISNQDFIKLLSNNGSISDTSDNNP